MLAIDPSRPPLLHEVSPFAALEAIAKWYGVEFTLFGGTASRTAMHLAYGKADDLDLFQIAPFTSDIDLVHSGGPDLTPVLKVAIRQRVPFATWSRWSLIDFAQWQIVRENIDAGTDVPLRSIFFSTARSLPWSEAAVGDLERRSISIGRRDRFEDTDFAKAGRTLEIFGLFMALNAAAEMRDIVGEARLDDRDDMLGWLAPDTANDDAQRVSNAEDQRLAVRAWHLGATRWARGRGIESDIAADWYRRAGVFERLGGEDPGPDEAAFTVSKPTASGGIRVPQLFPQVLTGADAEAAAERALHSIAGRTGVKPRIDPAFRVVAFVDRLSISNTAAADDRTEADAAFGSLPDGEFLQLSWPTPNTGALSAVALPAADGVLTPPPPAAAVGGHFSGGRSWLRIDVEEFATRKGAASDISLAVLALRRGATAPASPPQPASIEPQIDQRAIIEARMRRLREIRANHRFKL